MTSPDLASLLAKCLERAGLNARSAAGIEAPEYYWPHPPLVTNASLDGESLQPRLGVKVRFALDQLVDIYERFIGGWVFTRKEESRALHTYLRWVLRLHAFPAQYAFSPMLEQERTRSLYVNLTQFALVVAHNHPCSIAQGRGTLVVTSRADGMRFGVEGGRLVSNLTAERKAPDAGLDGCPDLAELARLSFPVLKGQAPGYGVARAWLEKNRDRMTAQEVKACLIALGVLRWCSPIAAPFALMRLLMDDSGLRTLADACKQARRFPDLIDPLMSLKEIFTPQFLTLADFAVLFGNPSRKITTPLSEEMRLKWEQAINHLDPEYGKGEEVEQHGFGRSEERVFESA